ncbi:MAG: hypothetical protein ACU837_09725 [Gammaproteobacteria bacterium]
MAIQKQFVLRYREEGHLRFEIPVQFCEAALAQSLTDKLADVEGVYRVKIYRKQRKLSLRYLETVCSFNELASMLFRSIADIEKQAALDKQSALTKAAKPKRNPQDKLKESKIAKWFNEKYGDAKETVQAAKTLGKIGLKKRKKLLNDPEKAVIDFLNDILVLFLIKLHWDHITKEWIPKPIKYRYEWLAVFYMLFLLMRSRNPK